MNSLKPKIKFAPNVFLRGPDVLVEVQIIFFCFFIFLYVGIGGLTKKNMGGPFFLGIFKKKYDKAV